ncbi:HipA domain-containing protein [Hymenobacter negativus]|uniref:HipA-like C-terminal domain-containing protein n=1 Tax=Hymenobacter negativus TaxID=2795026 RepID=A0ABS0Q8I5_9BACT|nr:hypothetical protein [Hymenobacter negativus]MBH8558966.1 hypothetical protein [Hymenobacter negativus]
MSAIYSVHELPANAPVDSEQLGTKRKFWCQHPKMGLCLFKMGRPGHGENWAEKACAHLAQLLYLPVAQIELAVWHSETGAQIGTLSPYMLPPSYQLVHGNEILEGIIADYPRDIARTSEHTVKRVLKCLGTYSPHARVAPMMRTAAHQFVGYLMFDAWVGNMDRHHENWALVQPLHQQPSQWFLSPTYDHGSSLGRELNDERKEQILQQAHPDHNLAAYASRGRGRFFRLVTDPKSQSLKPIDAFRLAAEMLPQAALNWRMLLRQVKLIKVEAVFKSFPSDWLTNTGSRFARALLEHNRQQILSVS